MAGFFLGLFFGCMIGFAICELTDYVEEADDFDTYLYDAESEDDYF